jgi:DNA-binding HxlR family transcriptional regulator
MDIRNLIKQQTPKEYVKISGRVLREQYDALTQAGVTEQTIVEAAYQEAYDQWLKLKIATTGGLVQREVIHREAVGEFKEPTDDSTEAKILAVLEKATESLSVIEIAETLGRAPSYIYSEVMPRLREKKLVTRKGTGVRGDGHKYYLTSHGDPDIESLVPRGTSVSVLR